MSTEKTLKGLEPEKAQRMTQMFYNEHKDIIDTWNFYQQLMGSNIIVNEQTDVKGEPKEEKLKKK